MNTPHFRFWEPKQKRMLALPAYGQGAMLLHILEGATIAMAYDNSILTRVDVVLLSGTGVIDKNGDEVYEGDVIRLARGERHESTFYHVEWSDDLPGWSPFVNCLYGDDRLIGRDVVVVGNVYENPRLLDAVTY